MLELDGSRGEGGGQIVRTAASLAAATATPFRMTNIRAGRSNPGLRPQHVTALRACADIADAHLEGATRGARNVKFLDPDAPAAGERRYAVGTAGSTTLVLHALLAPLLETDAPSSVVVEGGTHTLHAPIWEHFARSFLPLLESMGVWTDAELARPGFYPAGGGRVHLEVRPPSDGLAPCELGPRGELLGLAATSILADLPGHIARRELETLADALPVYEFTRRVRRFESTDSPGNALFMEIRSGPTDVVVSEMGKKGVPAEEVAERLADRVRPFLESNAAVDEKLADQMIVPMALAGGGRLTAPAISSHCRTQMEIVGEFLDLSFEMEALDASTVDLEVRAD